MYGIYWGCVYCIHAGLRVINLRNSVLSIELYWTISGIKNNFFLRCAFHYQFVNFRRATPATQFGTTRGSYSFVVFPLAVDYRAITPRVDTLKSKNKKQCKDKNKNNCK